MLVENFYLIIVTDVDLFNCIFKHLFDENLRLKVLSSFSRLWHTKKILFKSSFLS